MPQDRERKPHLSSLRTRYTVFAMAVIGLVLIVSSLGFLNLRDTQVQAARNLETRDSLTVGINGIRASLVEAIRSLDLFLMEPGVEAHRVQIDTAMSEALGHIRELHESEWIALHDQRHATETLTARLSQLHGDLDELASIRLDPALLYPSLAVGNDLMQPSRDLADNSLGIIFYELHGAPTLAEHLGTYQDFLQMQRLWMQMLSNFRLYLANRVGSFDEPALVIQENGISTMYYLLQERFEGLEGLEEGGLIGFESAMALEDLRRAVDGWFAGFEQAREIHQSDRWRMDAVLVKEKIAPGVDAVNRDLLLVEQAFADAISQDVQTITRAASRLAVSLWLVAALAVTFIVLLLVTTNRLVLRPIGEVTRALKAEAMGKLGVEMPRTRTLETRDLVEAFGEMHRQVRQRETELEYRALHDALTTLPNRTLLFERIEYDLRMARRQGTPLCLLMIDLDRFKEVNDTLGHQVGDSLLIEVASRLHTCLRDTDTVARLGGDEFAVLLPGTTREQGLEAVAKLLSTFAQPVNLKGTEVYVAASIGVALYPEHGDESHLLMQHADVAMYMAKREQSGFAVYDPDEDQFTLSRLEMLTDLRQAVEQQALELHFQPILSLATGEVRSVEALLRWSHPQHGQVSPELVIELAEQTGLIGPLTDSVIHKALAQAARWQARGMALPISVNLSMHNLHDARLPGKLRDALKQHGVPGSSLTLEVTETAMMANPHRVMVALNELDDLGVQLAVDDFGTGFSSLAYLKSLPVDVLKIDKSFVLGLEQDKSDQAIVQATLSLGHNLGMTVVAEGVESAESWDFLQQIGCDGAQGFHICRPLPADALEAWLENHLSPRQTHRHGR